MIHPWENETRSLRATNAQRPLTRSLDLGEEGLAMQATRTCSITGCDRPSFARTWCKAHHTRYLRHGDPTAGRPSVSRDPICTVEDCTRPHRAKGLCDMHWARWRRNGDPNVTRPRSAILPGAANSKWQGDEIGYGTAHERVRKQRGRAADQPCAVCGEPAAHWAYDHADPDERMAIDHGKPKRYSVKPEHYRPLCMRCHWRDDRGGPSLKDRSERRRDAALLAECLETLEHVGCQFWACGGPTLRPEPMVTCNVCHLIARLKRHIAETRGVPLP